MAMVLISQLNYRLLKVVNGKAQALKIRVSLVQILVSAPLVSRGYGFLAVTPFFVYGRSLVQVHIFFTLADLKGSTFRNYIIKRNRSAAHPFRSVAVRVV